MGLYLYVAAYILAVLAAAVLAVRRRASIELFHRPYWQFLLAPWKTVTFLVAGGVVTGIAPYTDDPTWDHWNGAFMSVFTYVSAPWTAGVLYRAVRKQASAGPVFIAVCAWLFSASWSYDLYLLARDRVYPETWLPNLFASSFLYLLAGFFWNLDWRPGRGAHFAFFEPDWPRRPEGRAASMIIWYALPFMLIVAYLILQFLFPL